MSTPDKFKYIWEYYRYYFFAFLVIIIVGIVLVNDYSDKKESALTITILGDLVDPNEINKIQAELNKQILTDEERKTHEVSIQVIPYAPDAADYSIVMAGLQRVSGEISTKELDLLFIDKDQFDMMNEDGYFQDLTKLIDGDLPIDKENIFYDSQNQVTGIDASAVPLFNEAIDDRNVVMGVLVNSERVENTSKLLQTLFED